MADRKAKNDEPVEDRAEADERVNAALGEVADAEAKAAKATAKARETTEPALESVAESRAEARAAMGDLDRVEQKARAGAMTTSDLAGQGGYTGEPHGLVGDAFGGPTAERKGPRPV